MLHRISEEISEEINKLYSPQKEEQNGRKQNPEDVLNFFFFPKVLAKNNFKIPIQKHVDDGVPKDKDSEPIGSHTYLAGQLN